MRQDLAGMLDQHAQDLVFPRRQLHLTVMDKHEAPHKIDLQARDLEDRPFALLLEPVPDGDAKAGDHLLDAEGLGDVVVGSEVQRLDDAGLVGAARQDQDREDQALARAVLPAAPCRCDPAARDRAASRRAWRDRSLAAPPRRCRLPAPRSPGSPGRTAGAAGSAARHRRRALSHGSSSCHCHPWKRA